MSKSSEQYFLGGLLNDIDKDINPDKFEKNISKDETTYKTSKEQLFSSNNSNFSQAFPTEFFHLLIPLLKRLLFKIHKIP